MMAKKPKKIVCPKCPADHFKTERGLALHDTRVHPYIPPKKTIEKSTEELSNESLSNGRNLEVGDVITLTRKSIIKQITKTEGKDSVDVVVEFIKKSWAAN